MLFAPSRSLIPQSGGDHALYRGLSVDIRHGRSRHAQSLDYREGIDVSQLKERIAGDSHEFELPVSSIVLCRSLNAPFQEFIDSFSSIDDIARA
jgi:hypothetical protein